MSFDNKPSIHHNRGSIGSAEELDAYGVWVKSEPQDVTGLAGLSFGADFDPSAVFETHYDDAEMTGTPSIGFEDTGMEADDFGFGDFDSGFDEIIADDADGSFDDDFSGDVMSAGFEADSVDIHAADGESEETAAEDESALQGEMSTKLLMRIADELSSIRYELTTLKKEFEEIKTDGGTPEEKDTTGRFFSGIGEKITLTDDEMSGLLKETDFSGSEFDETVLEEFSEKNEDFGENKIEFEKLGINFDFAEENADAEGQSEDYQTADVLVEKQLSEDALAEDIAALEHFEQHAMEDIQDNQAFSGELNNIENTEPENDIFENDTSAADPFESVLSSEKNSFEDNPFEDNFFESNSLEDGFFEAGSLENNSFEADPFEADSLESNTLEDNIFEANSLENDLEDNFFESNFLENNSLENNLEDNPFEADSLENSLNNLEDNFFETSSLENNTLEDNFFEAGYSENNTLEDNFFEANSLENNSLESNPFEADSLENNRNNPEDNFFEASSLENDLEDNFFEPNSLENNLEDNFFKPDFLENDSLENNSLEDSFFEADSLGDDFFEPNRPENNSLENDPLASFSTDTVEFEDAPVAEDNLDSELGDFSLEPLSDIDNGFTGDEPFETAALDLSDAISDEDDTSLEAYAAEIGLPVIDTDELVAKGAVFIEDPFDGTYPPQGIGDPRSPKAKNVVNEADTSIAQVIPEGFENEIAETAIPFDDDLEGFAVDELSAELDEPLLDEISFAKPEPKKAEPKKGAAKESSAVKSAAPAGLSETAGKTSAAAEIPSNLKGELKNVLSYMDHLLESLPEEKIEEFARSEYFDSYKKLFKDLGLA